MKLSDLHEESIGELTRRWTPKYLTGSQMIEWCKTHASQFLANKAPIYRGTEENLDGLLDTTQLKRESANSNGYYNWWIDGHPDWSDYPKRSQSLICSTDETIANNFGNTYLIIPADVNKIGICPEEDMWGSFKYLPNLAGTSYGDLNDFVLDLNDIITGGRAKNWKELSSRLKRTTLADVVDSDPSFSERMADDMKEQKVDNLYDLFAKAYFNPSISKFSHTTGANFKQYGNREVWVSGYTLQVDIDGLGTEDLYNFFRQFYTHNQLVPRHSR